MEELIKSWEEKISHLKEKMDNYQVAGGMFRELSGEIRGIRICIKKLNEKIIENGKRKN